MTIASGRGCMALWAYSEHPNLFETYEWATQARALHYTRLERLARDKHSSLLGLFLINENNEVL